jgi:protein SCO1/2
MNTLVRRLAMVVAMVLAGGIAGFGLSQLVPRFLSSAQDSAPALIGGPFTLLDQDGRPRSDAEFRGRLMLVFFGYTFCPDVCPLTLQHMATAIDSLGGDGRAVQAVFITVDPRRDTPDVVRDYVRHFSDSMIGLTGEPDQIADAAKSYRVLYRYVGDPRRDPHYLVEHTGLVFLMGRDGAYLTHFMHDAAPGPMAEAIRRYL